MSGRTERRNMFASFFASMPLWETWSDERPAPTKNDPNAVRVVNHCKSIPRRVRRDMARLRAKRTWQSRRLTA